MTRKENKDNTDSHYYNTSDNKGIDAPKYLVLHDRCGTHKRL